jgi:hypothetical protein
MSWPNGNPGYSGGGTISTNSGPAPALNQVGGPSFSFDLGAANAALKELYDDQKIANLVYKNNPFLAMVPKMEEFGGKYMPIPLIVNTSQGRSATFSSAQTNQTAATVESFALTRTANYSIAQIDNQTMLASKTDKMAFINGATVVIDGAIRALTNSLATQIFRSGTGAIGTIGSWNSVTGVVTLSNPSDIVNFEVNMTVETRSPASPYPLTSTAQAYIIAVNRTAGTFTVSGSMGGTAGFAWGPSVGDTVNVVGDFNLAMKGLGAWIPTVSPTTGDSFFGVDRSVDH